MFDIKYFTNTRFQVLYCLYETSDKNYCTRITQQEVAEMLHLSRLTVNSMLQQLRDDGFVEFDSTRINKYTLTQKGIEAVETITPVKD